MEVEEIEHFLCKEDPYTFALLALDIKDSFGENCWETEQMLKVFEEMLHKNLSSGTILARLEEDAFIAFAPFVLDKIHLMKVFDGLQHEYSEMMQKNYPERNTAVAIGCVTGENRTTLEQLCITTEQLVDALRKQGRHGYKIMEQN